MKQKDFKPLQLEQESKNYQFDSHYESSNLFASFRINTNEYDLIMQNDTNSKGNTQWFNFSVKIPKKMLQLHLTLQTFHLFNQIKQKQRDILDQGRQQCCLFKKQIQKENRSMKTYYTLSFSCKFEYSNHKVYFAQCYPYTYTHLNSFIDRFIRTNKFSTVSDLCKTKTKLN
ncbi:unnamed protein product [Paramecium sonneborni]|uniref:Uncharacterized protein n=1 Tax=Paramecium sonneborni TaxID=65129 RepID=A0A8S1RV14_9CILI|nr:unnamed protein product [Paramecium sonneborni]